MDASRKSSGVSELGVADMAALFGRLAREMGLMGDLATRVEEIVAEHSVNAPELQGLDLLRQSLNAMRNFLEELSHSPADILEAAAAIPLEQMRAGVSGVNHRAIEARGEVELF